MRINQAWISAQDIVHKGAFCKVLDTRPLRFPSMMIFSAGVVGLTAVVLLYALFKRFIRPSLSMIRGPKSPSFLVGRVLSLYLHAKYFLVTV